MIYPDLCNFNPTVSALDTLDIVSPFPSITDLCEQGEPAAGTR